jgi:hypothetical protein
MDGVVLQSKVYQGYARAALRVGLPFDIYRPPSASNPMATANKIGTIPAAFTVHSSGNFNFSKPSDYKGPTFHALLDGAQVRIGDYLKSSIATDGPFFIIGMDPIVPILAVQTNRLISIFRPDGAASKPIGVSGYGGTVASTANANETAIMTAWPASVLEGSRGSNAGMLPGDSGVGIWRVLLPAWTGVLVLPGYIITDDVQKRMVVRQAELTDFGWNIQAVQALV